VFGVQPGIAGDSARSTAPWDCEFTTAVTVTQPDSTRAACAVADAITLVTTIHLIKARIDFLLGVVNKQNARG
jgi:hypothetical protein